MEVTCLNLVLLRTWKKDKMREVAVGEGSDTFMSNTSYQGIENQCWVE